MKTFAILAVSLGLGLAGSADARGHHSGRVARGHFTGFGNHYRGHSYSARGYRSYRGVRGYGYRSYRGHGYRGYGHRGYRGYGYRSYRGYGYRYPSYRSWGHGYRSYRYRPYRYDSYHRPYHYYSHHRPYRYYSYHRPYRYYGAPRFGFSLGIGGRHGGFGVGVSFSSATRSHGEVATASLPQRRSGDARFPMDAFGFRAQAGTSRPTVALASTAPQPATPATRATPAPSAATRATPAPSAASGKTYFGGLYRSR